MNYQYLNTSEMQELERHAFEKYSISLEQMMESAGRAIFDVTTNEIINKVSDTHILIVSGKGNNGGDALSAAWLFHEKGIRAQVFIPYTEEKLSYMTKNELRKIKKSEIKIYQSLQKIDLSDFTLIIDALFGFSLTGNPYAKEAQIIEQINCSQTPILSVDIPSGLDVHNGIAGNPTITANYTVALGMPKKGMRKNYDIVGKLFLGDLGIPKQAYQDSGYEPPMFRGRSYISVN